MCERMKGALQAAMICVLGFRASAQGTFQNLDFESANPGPPITGPIMGAPYQPMALALPGWSASIGGIPVNEVLQNDLTLGAPAVVLVGPGPGLGPFSPIDGNYSVLLIDSFPTTLPSISQTGLVPAGTQTLLFRADPGVGGMNVSIGNENVAFSAVGTGPNYTLYGANISAWASQTEQLSFTAEQSPGLNIWEIDDISFSPNSVVPEPRPLALMGMGGFLFGLYRRVASKQQ
jgi:hypothetical protein